MTSDKAARPMPIIGLYDKTFWEYTKKHEFRLQKCPSCEKFMWPPAPVCDECLSAEITWEPLLGTGKILSWVVFHRQYFPGIPAPYNCVLIELDGGPLFIANLLDVDEKDIQFDMRVQVDFLDLPEGYTLPVFRPANG